MKQDKNFSVRLRAAIERKMREAGIWDRVLKGVRSFDQYGHQRYMFFKSLEDIKLSDLNKDPVAPAKDSKQYWLATAARVDGAGVPHGPFTPFDGPHDSPAGVVKALQSCPGMYKPYSAIFCMLEVARVPDLCPLGPHNSPHFGCTIQALNGKPCECVKAVGRYKTSL